MMVDMVRAATRIGIAIAWLAAGCAPSTGASSDDEPAPATAAAASALGGVPANARWSSVIGLPLVPAAAAGLPDGRLVLWAAFDRYDFGIAGANTITTVFDPQTTTATPAQYASTGHNMFCPGTTNLADGRILVNGGSSNTNTSIYDASTGAWTPSGAMSIGRGYQANTLLADGSVLTLGGSWSGDSMQSKDAEVWTAGTWRRLPHLVLDDSFSATAPSGAKYLDNHMWLFPMSNGRVLHAGPGVQMHWLDAAGDGVVQPIGPRGNDASSLNGSVVMYDVDKILAVGGAPDYGSTDEPPAGVTASNTAHVIELAADGRVSVTQTASMHYARVFGHAVVLPTGQVVVVGGSTRPKLFSDDYSVRVPELWDPVTRTFAVMPAHAVARPYHSVAQLLLDGRVLVGGGGLGPAGNGQPNVISPEDHPDVEILSPPYLFDDGGAPAARPVLLAAPASAAHGSTIRVTTDRAVSSFALVRLSSDTHSVNNDQRRVPLVSRAVTATTYDLDIPANRSIALAGSYMLFGMLASGTPSVAKVIQIGAALPAVREVPPPDVYVWRFFSDPATSGRPNIRSAYYYMATSTPVMPAPPAGYVIDVTSPSFMFQAWSAPGDGRVPIWLCRSAWNSHWLGNGCNGDTPVQIVFYAYPEPLRGSTKVLHYVSAAWGGKLIIPFTAQTKAQIDALDANLPYDPWVPWIDRSPNDRLAPFYVATAVPDRFVWRYFSTPGMKPDIRWDYAYLATPTPSVPPAPSAVFTLDTTTSGIHAFRAWSTPGNGRVGINHCVAGDGRNWLGYGCAGDAAVSTLFYAYPSSFAGGAKVLHYLNLRWYGKLVIPSHPGTTLQIDGLDGAPADWAPYINRTTINLLPPFWASPP